MTFTYSATATTATSLSQVRSMLGEVRSTDYALEDEEITLLLTAAGDIRAAAIACCDAILARLARDTDHVAGGQSSPRSQRTTHYRDVRERLIREAQSGAIVRLVQPRSGETGYREPYQAGQYRDG